MYIYIYYSFYLIIHIPIQIISSFNLRSTVALFCGLPSLPNPKAPGSNNSPSTVCWPLPARCPPTVTVGSVGSGPRYLGKGSQYGIMWDYMGYIYIEREAYV